MSTANTLYFPYQKQKRPISETDNLPKQEKTNRQSKQKPKEPVKPVIYVIILLTLFTGALMARDGLSKQPVSHVQENTPLQQSGSTQQPSRADRESLVKKITAVIDEAGGTYSVRFEDFKSTDAFGINDEIVVDAASVNKIPILAAVYFLANKNELDLDEQITIAQKDVQDYGTGSIRYEQQPIVHTVRELAKLMMEVSDNTAAYVLASRVIGLSKVQTIINDIGLTNTNMDENTTTNRDQAILLRAIIERKIASEGLSSEMLDWMDDSIFEDRLPAQIPKEVTVYHKIGNQVHTIHDVGVIAFEDNEYYLGVLTTDVPDESAAKETIAQISALVYEYVKGE